MHLIIDRGNTRTKFALFDDRCLVETVVCQQITDEFLTEFTAQKNIDAAIFCSVAGDDEAIISLLKKHFPFLLLMPFDLDFPISFDYDLHQLGADRIAAAVGARVLVPQGDLFVVDAGTCITYDFVSSDNRFEAGNIAPGFEMRLRAMHEFTGKLPLIKPSMPTKFIAQTTDEAMLAGAFNGIQFEIESYLRHFKQQNKSFQLILTGGIAPLLQNRIKNSNFVEPNLVLIGLNEILIRNKK